MARDDYELRRQARIDRLRARAEKAQRESESAFKRERAIRDPIPLGQPILVGHHSEKRHRNALKRADQAMRKGIDKSDEAERLRVQAAAAEANHAISSDDPNAVERLAAKVVRLERSRDWMKTVNAAWRKAKRPADYDSDGWSKVAEILGKDLEVLCDVRNGMRLDPLNRGPFPSYALQNIGNRIKTAKARIEEIRKAETVQAAEPITGDGFRIEERPDLNRITIVFDERPSRETCKDLRSRGWRWSPTEGAWMRHLNNAGRYAAQWFAESRNVGA